MKTNSKSVKLVCNECKHEFLLESVNIEETAIKLNGQVLKLVYFTCSKCNKIYRISLEDERCKELKEDLEKIKARIRKLYGSRDEELVRVLNNMVTKKHNRLRNHLKNLSDKFPGTFTFVTSKNNNEEKIIEYLP